MILKKFIETKKFQNFILLIIIINGIILGIQTYQNLSPKFLTILDILDKTMLGIFVIELAMKLLVYRKSFFKHGWNNFDFIIILISLIPSSGGLSILRAFRIFRVLRLVTNIKSIKKVVSGMFLAIPGVSSVAGLLLIFFYIGAVISTSFFGEKFPEWFGNLQLSMFTLFQIMTLESWSMGIVRPVMEIYPYSWLFFVPFIASTTFTVLNLFIGIIVDAMSNIKDENLEMSKDKNKDYIKTQIEEIKEELKKINEKVDKKSL